MRSRRTDPTVAAALAVLVAACAHDPPAERGPVGYEAYAGAPPGSTAGTDLARSPSSFDDGRPRSAAPYQVGLATWYGKQFQGKPTSNGERFDARGMTAAHRKLPFGTWVEVRRPETGRSVRVRINDRGPWGDDRRIIDLSQAAAEELGIVGAGVAGVELYVVQRP
jgi:rare lipoprotein A